MTPLRANFAHLGEHDEQFLRLGILEERYDPGRPSTCLVKLCQIGELPRRMTAAGAVPEKSSAKAEMPSQLQPCQSHSVSSAPWSFATHRSNGPTASASVATVAWQCSNVSSNRARNTRE